MHAFFLYMLVWNLYSVQKFLQSTKIHTTVCSNKIGISSVSKFIHIWLQILSSHCALHLECLIDPTCIWRMLRYYQQQLFFINNAQTLLLNFDRYLKRGTYKITNKIMYWGQWISIKSSGKNNNETRINLIIMMLNFGSSIYQNNLIVLKIFN